MPDRTLVRPSLTKLPSSEANAVTHDTTPMPEYSDAEYNNYHYSSGDDGS